MAALAVNRYRVTINAQESIFCAVYDVSAIDPAMAVYRAMAHACLSLVADYEINTTRQPRAERDAPEVHCLSVTA